MYPSGPSPLTTSMTNNYNTAAATGTSNYNDIMGAYKNEYGQVPAPTQFGYNRVDATRPGELNESYAALRGALPGYQEFANTGGYSPTDIQELRARGTSPIRAAYGNSMMQLDRARSLGGSAGAPNYIAALSKMQREQPGQMASAMTDVNARLAEDIRSGKLAGLGGMTQVGGQMGQLSSAEAGRQLQAAISNQGADLQSKGMTEESLMNNFRNKMGALGAMTSLYGTSPGMAGTFGNQVLGATGQENNYNLGLLNAQRGALNPASQGTPWWHTALKVAGTVAPYAAMAFSSRTLKEDIKPIRNAFSKKLKELPIYTWKYKGEDTTHMGPIAEEFKDKFGIGDGKTLHLADVMGVMLASRKEELANA